MKDKVIELNKLLETLSAEEIISYVASEYKGHITFASSLSIEDQVITHIISNIDKSLAIFTLDTGRLFKETYDLISETEKYFGIKINILFPDKSEVEEMVNSKGINLFYDSVENRKLCCKIRKINSLQKALSGKKAWICGLRREQSITRTDINVVEFDSINNLLKINPLINWSERDIWDYINKYEIPFNKLYLEGFASIGCAPCTRAIKKGEDIRAGRWWWEAPEHKECGLHRK
jgi:phosphoadenosine phosphosulfate reductase